MILSESTFEETEISFKHKCGPSVQTIRSHIFRQILDSLVNVFKHMGENNFPVVPRRIQLSI